MSENILNQAGRDIINALGVDATYNPTAGGPISCKVHLESETVLQPGGFSAGSYAVVKTLEALLVDIGKEPDYGETFIVGPTTYTVEAIAENDGYFVKAIVK